MITEKFNSNGIDLDKTNLKKGQILRALEIPDKYTMTDSNIKPGDLVQFNFVSDEKCNFINVTTQDGETFNVCADRFKKACLFVDLFVRSYQLII